MLRPQPRASRGPRLRFFRRIGEALATESTAECVRSGSVREAETNMESLGHMSAPATVDRDAAFTVEGVEF